MPDQNAAVGIGHDVLDADVAFTGQERDVRHALELDGVPRLSIRAAVRPRHTGELLYSRDLLARRLVILEDAPLDQQPLVCRHAFVIPRDAGERAILRAI